MKIIVYRDEGGDETNPIRMAVSVPIEDCKEMLKFLFQKAVGGLRPEIMAQCVSPAGFHTAGIHRYSENSKPETSPRIGPKGFFGIRDQTRLPPVPKSSFRRLPKAFPIYIYRVKFADPMPE